MSKISNILSCLGLAFCAGLSSCIYVIDDKGKEELNTMDSLQAYAILDSIRKSDSTKIADSVRLKPDSSDTSTVIKSFFSGKEIDTKNATPQQVIDFAKTLIGVPYKYASTDPKNGFDCSGFITYVFNHFGIIVPRSSIDFTEVGKEVKMEEAKPGDLVLFTGTDSTERFVGHMGIIVTNDKGQISFIHSTSGKAYGVTITALNRYYLGRYMKTVRIFPQNG